MPAYARVVENSPPPGLQPPSSSAISALEKWAEPSRVGLVFTTSVIVAWMVVYMPLLFVGESDYSLESLKERPDLRAVRDRLIEGPEWAAWLSLLWIAIGAVWWGGRCRSATRVADLQRRNTAYVADLQRDLAAGPSPVVLAVHPLEVFALFFGGLFVANLMSDLAYRVGMAEVDAVVSALYLTLCYWPFLVGSAWLLQTPGGLGVAAGLRPVHLGRVLQGIVLFGAVDAALQWGWFWLVFDPKTSGVVLEPMLHPAAPTWQKLAIVWDVVVAAPVLEEVAFRFLLFGGLRRFLGPVGAALWSAGLFALTHSYGLYNAGSIFLAGVVLAGAYEATRTLWVPIALHGVHNALWVVVYVGAAG